MMHRALVIAALAICTAADLAGQEVRLGVQVGTMANRALVRGQVGITLIPQVVWARPGRFLQLGLLGTAAQGGARSAGGFLAGEGELVNAGPLRIVLRGDTWASASSGYAVGAGAVGPRLRIGEGSWAAEVGPLLEVAARRRPDAGEAPSSHPLSSFVGPLAAAEDAIEIRRSVGGGATVRRAVGRVSAAAGVSLARLDAMTEWVDWTGGIGLSLGRADLSAVAGLRRGALTERWSSAHAAIEVTRSLSLALDAGWQPSDAVVGIAGSRFASVGLTVSAPLVRRGGPSPLPVIDPAGGRVRLEVAAKAGARVELLGDWSEWRPQPMSETEPGRFTANLSLTSGLYRFGLKVDGRWMVPSGFATEPDEFGGRRALFRVAGASEVSL